MKRSRARVRTGPAVIRGAVVTGMLVTAAPRALPAQSSTPAVVIEQSLGFGTMMPGVTETVSVQDGWRRAALRLDGSGQQSIRFILPTELVSSSGTIPLQFGGAAGAVQTSKSATLQLFDPQVGTKVNLTSSQGTARVYLGATALPARLQPAGSYTAQITVVIAPPNM